MAADAAGDVGRPAATGDDGGRVVCWCCGRPKGEPDVVRLGDHPEVAVCLDCAHFLHRSARSREDELRPSPAGRARDVLRAARALVMRRGWQELPVIGPLLRRLGPRLP
jgi:ribosome-binding protein aMBF1 (putative translation factor)